MALAFIFHAFMGLAECPTQAGVIAMKCKCSTGGLILLIFLTSGFQVPAQEAATAAGALPSAREIPGITSADKFPRACVDCHINMPDINRDERIGTMMSEWTSGVRKELLDKARSVANGGASLRGRHPAVTGALEDIPAACVTCHERTDSRAPPLGPLLHIIHLTGQENHFLRIFQGECTHCHKLDTDTGKWSMPTAPER